ncbi:hypothetical protein MUU53_10820, partial [Rhizobium lemnae]|uniref:hypothetical protein n=1 Tax=Rhizobium lemnae TaxID=1214924 RepID=UPI001FF2F2B3
RIFPGKGEIPFTNRQRQSMTGSLRRSFRGVKQLSRQFGDECSFPFNRHHIKYQALWKAKKTLRLKPRSFRVFEKFNSLLGQKNQKNLAKALAVFFGSEYITATDVADTSRGRQGD